MTDPRKDPTRPRYIRPKGELGICLDVYEAESLHPQSVGSEHFFRMNLTDSLYEEFSTLPLENIKGVFEDGGLLDGVIFEDFYKGIILSVSFDDDKALDSLWSSYEDGTLGKLLVNTLITPELLKGACVKSIQLRTRLWRDEYDAVKQELNIEKDQQISERSYEHSKLLISRIREYLKILPGQITRLRDQRSKVDSNFSEFIMKMKRNLSNETKKIANIIEFQDHVKIMSKQSKMEVIDDYFEFLNLAKDILNHIRKEIIFRLKQIHSKHESKSQHLLKSHMNEMCLASLARLETDFDLTTLKHPEWKGKFTAKEEPLFLGMFSLISFSLDTVIDLDQFIDEYLSGVNGK